MGGGGASAAAARHAMKRMASRRGRSSRCRASNVATGSTSSATFSLLNKRHGCSAAAAQAARSGLHECGGVLLQAQPLQNGESAGVCAGGFRT